MGLLESLDQTFGGPETQTQYALLRQQQIKAQAMADEQAKQRAAGTAQARLLGTMDPATGATLQAPPPPSQGNLVAPSYPLMGGQSTAPIVQQPLLGPADMNGQRGLLGGGPQDMRQSLMNQANPDLAMQRMQMAPALSGMSPEQRSAFMIDPGKAADAFSKAAFPELTPQQKVAAAVAKMDPNDPSRAALQGWLDKEGYIREKDPLVIADMKAGITEKEASARKNNLSADLLDATKLSDDTLERGYQQIRAGQKFQDAFPNMGRGTQGAAQMTAVQNYISKRMIADNLPPSVIAAANVNLRAQAAAAKQAAERGGKVDMAAYELENFIPQAEEAIQKLDNKAFVPWNKIANLGAEQINDPDLASLKTALQGVKGAYASIITRGGTPTVDAEKRGDDLLNTAQNYKSFSAVAKQMMNEAKAVKGSSAQVQADIQNRIGGGPVAPVSPIAPATNTPNAPASLPSGMVKQVGTYKGKPVYEDAQGNRHVETGP
jgi:hypothetical protein